VPKVFFQNRQRIEKKCIEVLEVEVVVMVIIIIIIIHEYYYGGAVALLLQDHLTMSVTERSQYLSATVQREHKTCPGVNPRGNTP